MSNNNDHAEPEKEKLRNEIESLERSIEKPATVAVLDRTAEIPEPVKDKIYKHPVVIILIITLFVSICCNVASVFAVKVVNDSKNDVQEQLNCSRRFTGATAEANAASIAALGIGLSTTLEGLGTLPTNDLAKLQEISANIPIITTLLEDTSTALEEAAEAQRASIKICSG